MYKIKRHQKEMKRCIKNEPIGEVLAIGLNPLLTPFKPQKKIHIRTKNVHQKLSPTI